MDILRTTDKMANVHSDIRGPIFVEALRMQAEGEKVLKLNTGNPATFGFTMPDSVRKALLENADKAVGYCDMKGMPDAREAICAYHKKKGLRNITPDDVFIGNGVSEIVSMAITASVNYNEEVLVPSPSYSLWTNAVYIAGAKPVFYTCDEQNEWNPDVEDIRRKITDKTRAIVIINPNNPTGALYTNDILQQIIDIAMEHNLIVFSDEIYDRLVMDDLEHTSTAALAPDELTVITTNGLSKSHCICGFRCGWMVITGIKARNQAFYDGVTQLSAMRLCSNALTQLVIPAALEDNESTRAMIVPGGRIYEQWEATTRALSRIEGVSFVKNKAAFYLFPRFDERFGITDDKKFAMDILHATKTLVIPGSGFDWHKTTNLRFVMLPEADELERAIDRIGEFLKTYRQS